MRSLLLLPTLLLSGAALAQSTATVVTNGTGQRVLVDQSASDTSSVDIQQIGTGGGVIAVQSGTGASLSVAANGDDQEHGVSQISAGTAAVTLGSHGDRNSSSITQTVEAGGRGEITLLQTGNDNRADLLQATQAAGANQMVLSQFGDRNLARLTQDGVGNAIDLTQSGSGLIADITQRGNNLGFAMTQTGTNTPITVTQSK